MLANFDMTPLSDASGITSCPDWDAAGVQATVAQIQTRDYSADLFLTVPSPKPRTLGDQVTFFAPSEKYYNRIPQNIYQVNWVKVLLACLTTNSDILGKPG